MVRRLVRQSVLWKFAYRGSNGAFNGLAPGAPGRGLARHRRELPVSGPAQGSAEGPEQLPGLPRGLESVWQVNGRMSEPTDRTNLESRWQRNETELRRLTNAPGLDRELNAARIDELLGEQDRIEFELGSTSPAGSRQWSGML